MCWPLYPSATIVKRSRPRSFNVGSALVPPMRTCRNSSFPVLNLGDVNVPEKTSDPADRESTASLIGRSPNAMPCDTHLPNDRLVEALEDLVLVAICDGRFCTASRDGSSRFELADAPAQFVDLRGSLRRIERRLANVCAVKDTRQ